MTAILHHRVPISYNEKKDSRNILHKKIAVKHCSAINDGTDADLVH